jgi:hypothetical protein
MLPELEYLRALEVRDLRQQASDVARRVRELDPRVQSAQFTSQRAQSTTGN